MHDYYYTTIPLGTCRKRRHRPVKQGVRINDHRSSKLLNAEKPQTSGDRLEPQASKEPRSWDPGFSLDSIYT